MRERSIVKNEKKRLNDPTYLRMKRRKKWNLNSNVMECNFSAHLLFLLFGSEFKVVEDEIRDWVMDEMCGVVSLHS
jgi:hypothetical protein